MDYLDSTQNYINPNQFKIILKAIPGLKIRKWYDYDIVMLFKIQYECALRPIEAIKLSLEDFNIKDREIYLGKTKTIRGDKVVIPKNFVSELENYLKEKTPGRLFKDLTYHTYSFWLYKLGKTLQIKAWITPQIETGEKTLGHIFRKSKGKDLLKEIGLNELDIISKHLRHSKPSITFDSYLKASTEAVKQRI